MKAGSNFVAVSSMREADKVLAQCFAEGFKAVASQNLNGSGYIVEFWK